MYLIHTSLLVDDKNKSSVDNNANKPSFQYVISYFDHLTKNKHFKVLYVLFRFGLLSFLKSTFKLLKKYNTYTKCIQV